MDQNQQLIVSFPDGSPSFVHGFEAGTLWQEMCDGAVCEIEKTTHTENRDVIRRMAVAEGWSLECEPSEVPGWDFTKLTKDKRAPERANPHGLHVVLATSSQGSE